MTAAAKLTLGPVLFNWDPEEWRDFYFRMADTPELDTICVGEVVCSKRNPLFQKVVPQVLDRLAASGKEIILSSLALIMSEAEIDEAAALAAADRFMVEANDISVAAMLVGRAFAVGPLVNVYNEDTLGVLERLGASRVCLPAELPRERIAPLAAAAKCELEVQVFGRLPLAISARCYAARIRDLAKDGCRFVCGEHPDGMDVDTVDEKPFLAVNGTQTLSSRYVNLLAELPQLRDIGIKRFRLSPQRVEMDAVAGVFRGCLDGVLELAEAESQLAELCPSAEFANGYFHNRQGYVYVEAD